MKKFSILFTLLLLVSTTFGQLVTGTFDDGNSSPTLTLAANVLSATLSASTKDQDCLGTNNKARKVSASNVQNNITLTIAPSAGFEMTITDVDVSLLLGGSSGTTAVTVGGVNFTSGSTAVGSTNCANLSFSGIKVSILPVIINIAVSGYAGNVNLTFDNLVIGGSVIAAVLPIELSKFNVKKADKSVMLSWATASEKNNDHFDIQKSSNGTQFQTIGQVKGSGTNLSGASYNFDDKNPSVGVAYYRLKQVDSDGKYAHTAVRSILFGKSKIAVFSTIAKERISLTVSEDQTVPFDIINLNGQTVLTGKAIGQYTIDISSLHSGMYFIRTEGGETTRFVKE